MVSILAACQASAYLMKVPHIAMQEQRGPHVLLQKDRH